MDTQFNAAVPIGFLSPLPSIYSLDVACIACDRGVGPAPFASDLRQVEFMTPPLALHLSCLPHSLLHVLRHHQSLLLHSVRVYVRKHNDFFFCLSLSLCPALTDMTFQCLLHAGRGWLIVCASTYDIHVGRVQRHGRH